jgi:hypothetical protein
VPDVALRTQAQELLVSDPTALDTSFVVEALIATQPSSHPGQETQIPTSLTAPAAACHHISVVFRSSASIIPRMLASGHFGDSREPTERVTTRPEGNR